MLDKVVRVNNYNIDNSNINHDITIVSMSDLHFNSYFKLFKLDKILDSLNNIDSEYLFINGDIIDSNNFFDDNNLYDYYVNWFKKIALKRRIFIDLGNHDYCYKAKGKKRWKFFPKFWKELNDIDNIYVSTYNNYYEDDKIIVLMLEPNYFYYSPNRENKKCLIDDLDKYKKKIKNLSCDKLKILVHHSPIYMCSDDIIKKTYNFDIVLAGHMHNGVIPFGIDKFIPGNFGIIAPGKHLFPKYARGIVKTFIENKYQYLIISGGISKFPRGNLLCKIFNSFYFMDIDKIKIISKKNSY